MMLMENQGRVCMIWFNWYLAVTAAFGGDSCLDVQVQMRCIGRPDPCNTVWRSYVHARYNTYGNLIVTIEERCQASPS
jgi:hypothetical protein